MAWFCAEGPLVGLPFAREGLLNISAEAGTLKARIAAAKSPSLSDVRGGA